MKVKVRFFLIVFFVLNISIDVLSQEVSEDEKLKLLITAYQLQLIVEEGNYKDECLFSVTEGAYQRALKYDSNHIKLNYNFGILYNNKASFLQESLEENISIEELDGIEKEMKYCLEKAKLYFDKVEKLQGK